MGTSIDNTSETSLKSFLLLNSSAEFKGFQKTFEKQVEIFFKRIDQLSKFYVLSEQDVRALRASALLLTAAWIQHLEITPETLTKLCEDFYSTPGAEAALKPIVQDCLRGIFNHSTGITQYPSVVEVFHDAALSMRATKNLEEMLVVRHSLHLKEIGEAVAPEIWVSDEITRLKETRFKTFAAQVNFGERFSKNISELQDLRAHLIGSVSAEEAEKKILMLYRSISRNLIDMIKIADRKAGLLLSANAISLSLLISFFGRGLNDHPRLWASAILIAGTCAMTVYLASLAARPINRTKGNVALDTLLQSDKSLLHYGNAARLSREDFLKGFRMIMKDDELLEEGLIGELHFYSCRVIEKMTMVRRAYVTMFVGIFLSFVCLLFSKVL